MTTPLLRECREILQDISAYLDGDLDRTACDAIERHSAACPRCAAVVAGLRETVGLCRQAARADLPDPVRERAKAAVRQLLDQNGG